MDEEVPASLQAKIRAFKNALVTFSDSVLECEPPGRNPKKLESTMASLLDANQPAPPQQVYDPDKAPQLDHIYGDGLSVKVTAPENVPNLLLVDLGFNIACGDDSILLAYELRQSRWRRVLRWQSGNYTEVKDAFGDFFQYVALPSTNSDGFLLAAAHGSPWCTSRWSGFDLDLLEPSTPADSPKLLQHIENGYVRFEIEPVMKLAPGGFQLRLETGMIDMDLMTRIGIYRYRINGNHLQRVQPIANNGRDFVDEWLQSPWREAIMWSLPSGTNALKTLHDRIVDERNSNEQKSPSYFFGPVRKCADSPSHFQVQLDAEWFEKGGAWKPAPTTYFQIQEGKNSFIMLSAAERPDTRCSGPDLMPKSR
jgi:hypothetical protein